MSNKKRIVSNYERVRKTFLTQRHAKNMAGKIQGGEVVEIGNFFGVYFPKEAQRINPKYKSKK